MLAVLSFSAFPFLHSGEITSQFEIIDPLNRGVIRVDDHSIIENDFFRYDFSGYSLRDDRIIDFGIEPEMESLTFTTYQGTDWMDASKSHYFEIIYWNASRTFKDTISGPSWFSTYHHDREDKHEEYFYTKPGFPAYLIISWEKIDFKVDGFKEYFYSLLIDGTKASHRSFFQSQNYENKPWVKISMQSMVGIGSNLSIAEQVSNISTMVREIADKVTIKDTGSPSPRVDQEAFNSSASNSSPYSFIDSVDQEGGWHFSSWFGDFYKSKPGWIYHLDLGWIYYAKYTQQSSWCWHPVLSWFWISNTTYPYVLLEDESWSYFQMGTNSLLAYDFEKMEWRSLNDLIPSANDSFSERISKIQSSFMSEENKKSEIAKYLLTGK